MPQGPSSHPGRAPSFPDFMLDPDAVLKDSATWRSGAAPNYSNTRLVYERTKKSDHKSGSLETMVENLVKNWEIEASFKTSIDDWRTINQQDYTFAVNGGEPQDAEHMLKVGTYNAIIAPSSFYSGDQMDFEKSHRTFKKMMPTFAWEVLEVYSGPPRVTFKWRHWGEMKSDYEGWNDKGDKVSFKAHGGLLDIQGITVAKLDKEFKIQTLETWFDPLEMFRQFTPKNVTVDGKPLDEQTADDLLQGKEGIQAIQALTDQLGGMSPLGSPSIELQNPHARGPGSRVHQETRSVFSSPAIDTAPRTGYFDFRPNPSSACPFTPSHGASGDDDRASK